MNDIIPIDSEVTTFSEYLNNNCRGILSARFGDGKSFFLNEVKKQLSNKYLFLTIYPVNYQVAENKDIFEYIKRDILLQILMTSEIDFSDEKYGFSLRLWGFLNQNGKDLVSDIVSLIASSLANIPQDAIKVFRNNIAKFKDFSERANHSQSDSIESYLDEFASRSRASPRPSRPTLRRTAAQGSLNASAAALRWGCGLSWATGCWWAA